jgi:hypothetical protein
MILMNNSARSKGCSAIIHSLQVLRSAANFFTNADTPPVSLKQKKRLERATRRWRVVGVAASVLACASFVIQLRSFESNNSNQVVVERPVNADQAEAVTTNHKAAADDWLTLLTMERRTVGDDRDVLRASSSMQIFSEQNDPAGELTPIGPSDQESILQPGDFQQFL